MDQQSVVSSTIKFGSFTVSEANYITMSSSGIAVGLNKGYPVNKKQVAPRPASRKGRAGKKTKLVRDIVREVVGLMPYEKRILDMIKSGGSSAEKRIYKFSKKRLGTHRRALRKREEMKAYYAALRAKAVHHA